MRNAGLEFFRVFQPLPERADFYFNFVFQFFSSFDARAFVVVFSCSDCFVNIAANVLLVQREASRRFQLIKCSYLRSDSFGPRLHEESLLSRRYLICEISIHIQNSQFARALTAVCGNTKKLRACGQIWFSLRDKIYGLC